MSRKVSPEKGFREGVQALVVGAGRFGSRALKELQRLHPDWRLMAVDRDPNALSSWTDRGVTVRVGEAVETLDRLLKEEHPRWIVPAVPFHLAHAWLFCRLSKKRPVEQTAVLPKLPVPNPFPSDAGDLYTSFATFICPEDCPEPRGTCTVTGESRPLPLFKLLSDLVVPGQRILGLRSHQLGLGVGGYRGADLWKLLTETENLEGDLVLYTACRCHGVLSGLRLGPRHES